MGKSVLKESIASLAVFVLSLIYIIFHFVYLSVFIAFNFTMLLMVLAGGTNFRTENEGLLVLIYVTFLLFYAEAAKWFYDRFSGWKEEWGITVLVRWFFGLTKGGG